MISAYKVLERATTGINDRNNASNMRTPTSLCSAAVIVLVLLQTVSAWKALPALRMPLVDGAQNLATRLTQADGSLETITAEQNAALAGSEERVDDLVDTVHAKGTAFGKCSLALVKAKEDAFEAAYTGIYACDRMASADIRTLALTAVDLQLGELKACSMFDVTCVLEAVNHRKGGSTTQDVVALNERLDNVLAEGRRCMALAANGVHDVVSELSVNVLECDAETAKVVPVQPQRNWIKKNKRKIINTAIATCVKSCYALIG